MSTENAADQYHDGNERDVEAKQTEPVSASGAVSSDSDVDPDDVKVLPGTGGPDDGGDTEIDPSDYNPRG